jgi:hypothetical protein
LVTVFEVAADFSLREQSEFQRMIRTTYGLTSLSEADLELLDIVATGIHGALLLFCSSRCLVGKAFAF